MELCLQKGSKHVRQRLGSTSCSGAGCVLEAVMSSNFSRCRQSLEQALDLVLNDQCCTMTRTQEALADSSVEEGDQRVIVAVEIEQRTGLAMDLELCPCPGLEQLVHGADASGQRDECIGQLAHEPLALRQRLNDMQTRQDWVAHLMVEQHLRTTAVLLAGGFVDSVRIRPHVPTPSASVDEPQPTARERTAEFPCQGRVLWLVTRARATEDAQGLH